MVRRFHAELTQGAPRYRPTPGRSIGLRSGRTPMRATRRGDRPPPRATRTAVRKRASPVHVSRYLLRKTIGWLATIVVATNLTYFLANAFLDPSANYLQL